jgi:hypothetical protein
MKWAAIPNAFHPFNKYYEEVISLFLYVFDVTVKRVDPAIS